MIAAARRVARWLAPASLLLFLASPALAGTVTGTVTNGTTGKPAAGAEVILIQLQGTMRPVATTKTDAEGHYSFDNPGLGAGPMLIRAVYRGVNYHEPATPGKTTVDVEVFEPTDKASAFSVTAHAIILQPSGSDLVVGEEYNISNKTQPPVAYYRPEGSFMFALPDGAHLTDVSVVGTSGMPVVQSPLDKGNNEQAIQFPFRPGDSVVRISYHLPYPGDQASLRFMSYYSADRLAFFAPPSVHFKSAGFVPGGEAQGFSVYMRESVAAKTPISVDVSGTAPPPAPDNGGSTNAANADDSQNPSVNSRADSGAETPVASLTTLPARLDSLKWILVGGFAALFALGLIYVWRQPEAAVAGAPNEMAAPPLPGRNMAKPARNVPAEPASSANVDREVRSSLDQLKDTLFRLELRREAGTIAEDEYVRERDRVQKTLRDLVKG
jgi:Carboxypeptidase regulatory-like domain